jgi:hypothetical protein
VPAPSLGAQLAAAIPAIFAAVHAFRSGLGQADASETPPSIHQAKEKAA